jgi:type I restriction enzyme, R subunit
VASGGVVFTTIQKFLPEGGASEHPLLSDRHNIVFIVDEAHRTQYGFEVRYVRREDGLQKVYGLAKYMRDALPNAAFIGFTGTPISLTDRNTRNVFGDYLDVYDIQQAVEDEATVPIYYDARHAKLKLDERFVTRIDPDFEEVTEGQEAAQKELLKSKWAQIAAVVGEPDRLRTVAEDIVAHYEERNKALPGKAMIVCMTREICVRMHDELIRLRPEWHSNDDDRGTLKVVMTGSAADGPDWQDHIRNQPRRKALAERFRRDVQQGEQDDFRVVIVRDMWLTGFDAPSLHTMYVDKPMKGHSLMQAIARVNRVYPGKDGGLVVAYLPLQLYLQEALKDYTEADREQTGRLQEEAAALMVEKYEVVKAMLHGFDYAPFFQDDPAQRLTTLARALNHILAGRDKKRDRFIDATTALGRAYGLATPHALALAIRDEVGFFQALMAALKKTITTPPAGRGKSPAEVDREIQAIVDRAVAPEGVIDIFAVAGLDRPDISILSDEFLLEVEALPGKNVAVELLRRLIEDEIRARRRRNLIQSRSFEAMLRDTLDRYNRMILEKAFAGCGSL